MTNNLTDAIIDNGFYSFYLICPPQKLESQPLNS